MPCQIISCRKKIGRKNNLISQTVHLARQHVMFIFTFNQFTASVYSLQFPSLWIDHMRAAEGGVVGAGCGNFLAGPMSLPPLRPLDDWFRFSFHHPLTKPFTLASLLPSLLPFAIHTVFLRHGGNEFRWNRSHVTQKKLISASTCSDPAFLPPDTSFCWAGNGSTVQTIGRKVIKKKGREEKASAWYLKLL